MKRLLVVGHSHIESMRRAWKLDARKYPNIRAHFVSLRTEGLRSALPANANVAGEPASERSGVDREALTDALNGMAGKADLVVLCPHGSEHHTFALWHSATAQPNLRKGIVAERVAQRYTQWLEAILPLCPGRVALLPSPPPMDSSDKVHRTLRPENLRLLAGKKILPSKERLALWQEQCESIQRTGAKYGLITLALPESVFSPSGLRSEIFDWKDPAHCNTEYGKCVLDTVIKCLMDPTQAVRSSPIAGESHPYVNFPDYAFWKRVIGEIPTDAVDPVVAPPFTIRPSDAVATAGSCFAQHISKRLRTAGFRFLVTEKALIDSNDAEERGYYDFSARYGNVYTARQLLQLFDRSHGYFRPLERAWPHPQGGYCDPFRPRIEPHGLASEEDVVRSSRTHLAAVRQMFRQLSVFVFTLGLTECWLSKLDGAAYPIAPGVAGGMYDGSRYAFVNFTATEVAADLDAFLRKLRLVNPKSRVILTVSPVPLVATAEARHVLVSTTYSKAALRVAAEEIVKSHKNIYYFPSYEIVTGNHTRGTYFGEDRRSVTEAGVDHVMRIFMSRLTEQSPTAAARPDRKKKAENQEDVAAKLEAIAEAECDEELLDR